VDGFARRLMGLYGRSLAKATGEKKARHCAGQLVDQVVGSVQVKHCCPSGSKFSVIASAFHQVF
jgi:hypothetical protein